MPRTPPMTKLVGPRMVAVQYAMVLSVLFFMIGASRMAF
jgi:hypothetical protein